MAVRYNRARPQEQPFAMAPMVDMVFLLLVFFMCVTAVSGGRAGVPVALPQTVAAKAKGQGGSAVQAVLTLSDDALLLNGRPCAVAELLPQLLRLRAQAGTDASVRIRADADAPYQKIEPLLRACAQAGFASVSYAAHEAEISAPVVEVRSDAQSLRQPRPAVNVNGADTFGTVEGGGQ